MRVATAADLDAVLALEQACYPPRQAYGREEYRYALRVAKAVNLLHEEDGRVVGFVGAFHHRTWRTGHVYTVNVHPSQRGRGLGVRLMAACHDALAALGMERVVLEVNVDNQAAIALYEKCGYRLVRRLPDYYTTYDDNDAFLYERDLRVPARGEAPAAVGE